MARPSDVSAYVGSEFTGSSPTVQTWPGVADYVWPKPTRYVRCATAGVLKFTDASGAPSSANFAANETRALITLGVTFAATTVTGVEGMP